MKLDFIAERKSSSVQSKKFPGGGPPLLLIKISGSGQAFIIFSLPSLVLWSVATPITFTPVAFLISSHEFSRQSYPRDYKNKSTHSQARAIALPLPIPALPPLIIAFFPLIPKSIAHPKNNHIYNFRLSNLIKISK